MGRAAHKLDERKKPDSKRMVASTQNHKIRKVARQETRGRTMVREGSDLSLRETGGRWIPAQVSMTVPPDGYVS